MKNKIRRKIMAAINFCYKRLPKSVKRLIIRGIHFIFYKKRLRLEFHLVEHCNLGCKGCNHFSPIAEEGYVNAEELIKDLNQLRNIFGARGVSQIEMLGGEPLLHPDCAEIIRNVRAIFPYVRLYILTNGLLLKRMDKFFYNTCKENDVCIMVTTYPINFDYNSLVEEINSGGVSCELFNYEKEKTLFKQPLDLEGSQDAKRMFDSCVMANNCVTLKNHRLYTCMTIPTVEHFNKYFGTNLMVSDSDSIDIYEVTDKKKIKRFLNSAPPFCRYCKVEEKEFDIKWECSKKQMEEWI